MPDEDEARVDRVVAELAEVPVDPDDAELAAIAIAVHLEEALQVVVPPDTRRDAAHLATPAARERTVRQLLGGL